MKKLLTLTILFTTLISCSQGIEEYTCLMEGWKIDENNKIISGETKIYTQYFTFDTKNNLWNSDGDFWTSIIQQGRISQKNDYFYELSVRDIFGGEEDAYYVFDRKKKKLYDARWLDNLDIAYFTSYYNEDEKYFNCK